MQLPPLPQYRPRNENKTILYIVLFIILLLLSMYFSYNAGYDQNEKINQRQAHALTDSIKYFKNKHGEEVAQKLVYVGSIKELKQEVYKKDTLLMVLQEKISKLSDNVTVLKQRLSMTGSAGTVITNTGHSIIRDDTLYVYPTYTSFKEDSTIEIKITANSDTITWDLSVINYLSVEQTYEKHGFLGLKRQLVVQVTNSNDYIKTEGLQSFKVPPKPKEKLLKTLSLVAAFGLGVFIAK